MEGAIGEEPHAVGAELGEELVRQCGSMGSGHNFDVVGQVLVEDQLHQPPCRIRVNLLVALGIGGQAELRSHVRDRGVICDDSPQWTTPQSRAAMMSSATPIRLPLHHLTRIVPHSCGIVGRMMTSYPDRLSVSKAGTGDTYYSGQESGSRQ